MFRICAAVTAAALLAVPAAVAKDRPPKPDKQGPGEPAAVAKERPAKPEKQNRRKQVMYVLKGVLSAYTEASDAGNGTITIKVAKANRHGRPAAGASLTFAVVPQTKVVLDDDGAIGDGERGLVKVRAPKGLSLAELQELPARRIVDHEDE